MTIKDTTLGTRKRNDERKRYTPLKYNKTSRMILGHSKQNNDITTVNLTFKTDLLDLDFRINLDDAKRLQEYLNKTLV